MTLPILETNAWIPPSPLGRGWREATGEGQPTRIAPQYVQTFPRRGLIIQPRHLRWSVKGFLKRNPPDVHIFFHNLHTSFRDGWAGSCWMATHSFGLRRSRDFRYFCSL